MLRYRLGLTTKAELANRIVVPSGGDLAAMPMLILPPAPARFSTTNCWPRLSPIFWLSRRAMTSVGPPGAKPTSTLTGLLGYACAAAGAEGIARPPGRSEAPAIKRPLVIILPPR